MANTLRLQATKCPPSSMGLATNVEGIIRLPLKMELPNSQLRTTTRSPPRRRLRLTRKPPRRRLTRLTRNLPRIAEHLARKTSMSLSVIHSREASVAVPDRSDLLVLVKTLLTTLISRMPALTAIAM